MVEAPPCNDCVAQTQGGDEEEVWEFWQSASLPQLSVQTPVWPGSEQRKVESQVVEVSLLGCVHDPPIGTVPMVKPEKTSETG